MFGRAVGLLSVSVVMLLFAAVAIASSTSASASASSSYSPSSLTSLLQSYSVPNAVIDNLQTTNITYNGTVYAAMYDNGQLSFLINTASDTFVTNQTDIFNVIKNYTLQQSISQANFTKLYQEMMLFQNTAAPQINLCLAATGLNVPNATCTFQNYCESCQTVSACSSRRVSANGQATSPLGAFGLDSPFGYGVIAFERNDTWLNENYTEFYGSINAINSGNIAVQFAAVNSSFENITAIADIIWQNPLFPPTENVSGEAGCVGAPIAATVPLHGSQWYCDSTQYCPFITYKDSAAEASQGGARAGINFTLLNDVNATIQQISSLPFSNAQIMSVASGASVITGEYVTPLLDKQKSAELSGILNTTLARYGVVANSSAVLLTHVTNASLALALARIQSNYSIVTSQYVNLNLTQYNKSLGVQMATLVRLYKGVNATYSDLTSTAANNTNTIVQLQLNGNADNAQLSSLAYQQFSLNTQLSGKVSNTIAVQAQLNAVKSGLAGINAGGDNPVSSLSRSLGSASAESIAPSFGLPYAANVALAPIFASIPAILIAVFGLIILFIIHVMLGKRNQTTLTMQQKRGIVLDSKILTAVGALLILYMVLSIALAYSISGNNAPVSVFRNAIQGSGTVALVLNGTQTPGMLYCSGLITTKLDAMHKAVATLTINGIKCVVDNTTVGSDTCLNSYAERGLPIIILTNSSVSSISVYSLYGTTLTETGNSTALAACTAATAI